uniref:Uncharacterized protein n=1 Tax=Caenorhabditis japonica TaxID=281687 RepID=A0A8R1E1U0_CAEJA
MAAPGRRSQGVISGDIKFKNAEYVEIFDKDYQYLYGVIDDLFVAYGTWVEYVVTEAPRDHPKNCKYFAKDVRYVDVKCSKAPTSDEFRSNDMNVRDYNKVDFFQYVIEESQLTYKGTVKCDYARGFQYYNSYYGYVIIGSDSHRRLVEHRIGELDVMMNLIPSRDYTSGAHWKVTHFINQGKCYSINGFLSITGHVHRGPGGVVRDRTTVTVPTDALRPRNYQLPNNSLKNQSFGHETSPSDVKSSLNSTPSLSNESQNCTDPFDGVFKDTVERTNRLTLDQNSNQNNFGNRRHHFGSSRTNRDRSPIGLGRLSKDHF